MKRYIVPILAFSVLAFVACNQATNTTSSSSPYATGSSAASPRASGSVAASAPASASASASTKYIDLQVTVPQPNMNAGIDGMGWTVDVIAKGNGPAMDKIKPAFQSSTSTGHNVSFPGLVVLLKPASGGSGASGANANTNLAKLFQVIGLPNTIASGAGISSVGTNASSSPATSASAGTASASPAGSAATRTTATDTDTAEATWFVQQATWGKDVDVELTVFVVDGDAPDTLSDTSNLKIVSNEVTVRFHINGGTNGPSGSARPSGSAAPSGSTAPSTAPGSASPSPSASSTP